MSKRDFLQKEKLCSSQNNTIPILEVLDEVLKLGDAQELAQCLSCSPQLIRSYCRPLDSENEFDRLRLDLDDR